jgi:hypothetical protein
MYIAGMNGDDSLWTMEGHRWMFSEKLAVLRCEPAEIKKTILGSSHRKENFSAKCSPTTGIWFLQDPSASSHYEFMIGQGYNTEGLVPSEFGSNFALGASAWLDVVGSYGPARPTDFEFLDELAVRLGTSVVTSTEGKPGRQLEETDFLRLTDGTRLTSPNALAPGATVESFQVSLLAIDAAFKYRGWSANGEYFVRSIDDLYYRLLVLSSKCPALETQSIRHTSTAAQSTVREATFSSATKAYWFEPNFRLSFDGCAGFQQRKRSARSMV